MRPTAPKAQPASPDIPDRDESCTEASIQDRVLFRDGWVIVLDKPAGLAVHKGPSGGPSLEPWFSELRFGFKDDPQPAHRLDRDTSGCLVLARNRRALRRLGALFTDGGVHKTYWAVVAGHPAKSRGRIDLPLLKRNSRAGWSVEVDPDGQRAITDWRVLATGPETAWLELTPRTGRTHQLRVHLAANGWPILGDPHYAPKPIGAGPMLLHSRTVDFKLREDLPQIAVTASPPAPFQAAVAGLDPVAQDGH